MEPNYKQEIERLRKDPVYLKFLADIEKVISLSTPMIRVGDRLSILDEWSQSRLKALKGEFSDYVETNYTLLKSSMEAINDSKTHNP